MLLVFGFEVGGARVNGQERKRIIQILDFDEVVAAFFEGNGEVHLTATNAIEQPKETFAQIFGFGIVDGKRNACPFFKMLDDGLDAENGRNGVDGNFRFGDFGTSLISERCHE